jgi:2-C-methyl-D-erythritol 2,4-cyclodiphosphate synthase
MNQPGRLGGIKLRIGSGYDVHRLVPERKLVLGGVEIPYIKGLLGHSDADVLVHAICDALLGAAGLGDIGKYFPDSDGRFKNISSLLLLTEVDTLVKQAGFTICNIDSTIIAQEPRLAGYIEQMRTNIAGRLNINKMQVNIKATTTERLGYEGRGEGISAQAVALIE